MENSFVLMLSKGPDDYEGLQSVCAASGLEILFAADRDEFLGALDNKPAVVIFGTCTPGFDGIEVIHAVTDGNHDIPAIVVSSRHSVMRDIVCKYAAVKGINVIGVMDRPIDLHGLGKALGGLNPVQVAQSAIC